MVFPSGCAWDSSHGLEGDGEVSFGGDFVLFLDLEGVLELDRSLDLDFDLFLDLDVDLDFDLFLDLDTDLDLIFPNGDLV